MEHELESFLSSLGAACCHVARCLAPRGSLKTRLFSLAECTESYPLLHPGTKQRDMVHAVASTVHKHLWVLMQALLSSHTAAYCPQRARCCYDFRVVQPFGSGALSGKLRRKR